VKRAVTKLALCAALCTVATALAAGDPVKGAKLHDDCLGCHGTELYVAPRAKVKTLAALKRETEKWNDRMNPKFTRKEIEDLVAWLNATFYKFPP
jgi:mono/diheme cytochrome c family protein